MEDMEKVAVVILNWNGCEMLRSFLPSVVAHSEADGAVVYVADNKNFLQCVLFSWKRTGGLPMAIMKP